MQTISGIVLDSTGAAIHTRVHFESLSTPIVLAGGTVLANFTKTVKSSATDGSFSVALEAGVYQVTYDTTPRTMFKILVPQGTGSLTIDQVLYSGANVLPNFVPSNFAPGQAGHGNPNTALIGAIGQTYLDVDTGNFFVNSNNSTGWTQLIGNSAGAAFTALVANSGQGVNLTFVGNPEGNVIGTPGQCGFATDSQSFWCKASGTGNTGWIELIGNV